MNSTLPLQLLASDSMTHPLPLINIRITQGQRPLLTAQAAQRQQHCGSQRSSPSLGVLNEAPQLKAATSMGFDCVRLDPNPSSPVVDLERAGV